jgi:integrase/recombinase XerD
MNKSSEDENEVKRSVNQNPPSRNYYADSKVNKLEIPQKEINKSYFIDLEIIHYYIYTERNNYSKSTQKEYLSELKSFYEFLLEHSKKEVVLTTTYSLLQQLNLESYFNKYLEFIGNVNRGKGGKLYSKNTIHRKISVIKNFLDFLNKRNITDFHPNGNLKYPNIQQYSRNYNKLSFLEAKELLQYYKEHPILYALLSILITTGIKLSELCSLKVKNIESSQNEFWLVIENTGGKRRSLLLLSPVIKSIITFRARRRLDFKIDSEDNTPLFVTAHGKAYSQTYLGNFLTNKLNDPNLSYMETKGFTVTSATLRLTYATLCSKSINDFVSLKESLGHKDIKNTDHYLRGGQEK